MLFRYRPRQTWMPFAMPRPITEQERYNLQLQQQFEATRRTPQAPTGAPARAASDQA